ncbi:hypothetical protein ACIRQP_32265 [Streptomyces sp. NPDC102274]
MPDDTLGAAAVVLTNCDDAKEVFTAEVCRLTSRSLALVSH